MPTTKVALITGSGKHRIGNVVAMALADRGYDIALHYNRSAEEAQETVAELEQKGVRAAAFQADVANETDVARLFDAALAAFGRLDVLVTAAAVWQPKPLEDVTAEDVRRQFDVNTLGTFLCCQRAGLIMARQPEGGAIVTIGDWATARPYPGLCRLLRQQGRRADAHPRVGRRIVAAQPGRAGQLHRARPGDGARGSFRTRSERRHRRNASETPGPPGKHRPGCGFPGRKRLYYRYLPAGGRRSNDRLDVAAMLGPKRGEQVRRLNS